MIRSFFSKNITVLHNARIHQRQITSMKSTYSTCRMTTCRNFNISAGQKLTPRIPRDELDDLMSVYPVIEKDLMGTHLKNMPSATAEYFTKFLHHTLRHRKLHRAFTILSIYKLLKGSNITQEDIKLACILGWCTEMLDITVVIMDDIADQSDIRREKPCWYKLPEVGLQAINDSFIIENAIFATLKKYFSNHPFYTSIVELIHEGAFRMALGQMLDLQAATYGKLHLEAYNIDTYYLMVYNKTTFYTLLCPIVFPLYLAQRHEPMLYAQLFPILERMGIFLQIKDDILDCYGEESGEGGTDIRTGKRNWLAITALQYFTPNQRELFEQHYGMNTMESEEIIRNLYNEIGLPEMYARYEEEFSSSICSDIADLPQEDLAHQMILKLVEMFMKVYLAHVN